MSPRIFALLLAGGESRRMGTNKLALVWKETTVLGYVAGELAAAPIDQIFLVVGPTSWEFAESLGHFGKVIRCEQTADMRSTIAVGVGYLGEREQVEEDDGVLVALGDQPTISRIEYERMVASYQARPGWVHVATYEGKRAHPTVLPWKVLRKIHDVPVGMGLNALVKSSDVVEVAMEKRGVLDDLDSPADYERLSGSSS